MKFFFSYIFILLSLLHGLCSHAFAAPGDPLPIRDMYPLTNMHLSTVPHSAQLLNAGQHGMSSRFLWATTNAIRAPYVIDAETRELRFGWSYGLSDDREISIEWPLVYRGGGTLDSFIESWHDFWGLPNGRRGRVSKDSFEIQGSTKNGEEFAMHNDGVGSGNTQVSFSQRLFTSLEEKFLLNLEARLSLPTSSSSLGHAGVDSSLGLTASLNTPPWYVHIGVAGLRIGDNEISHVRYALWRYETFASIVYLFEHFSLASSLTYTSEVVTNIAEHPNYTSFLDVGGSIPLSDALALELGIREEIVSGNGSQDIGFLIGLEYRPD